MTKFTAFIFLFTLLLFSGCKKDSMCNCLKNTGDEISENRYVPDFTSIEMNNNVDVVLIPDTFYSLKVICGKNLMDGIKTEVTDNTLRIKNINKCNWLRDFENKFTVEIPLPTIEQITNNGSGNLTCADTLKGYALQVDSWNGSGALSFLIDYQEVRFKLHTGPADIIALGKSYDGYVYNAGNGFFKGSELKTEYCYVISKGTGDTEVYAAKELGATIEYQGDIYYSGDPQSILQTISGTGKLIKR